MSRTAPNGPSCHPSTLITEEETIRRPLAHLLAATATCAAAAITLTAIPASASDPLERPDRPLVEATAHVTDSSPDRLVLRLGATAPDGWRAADADRGNDARGGAAYRRPNGGSGDWIARSTGSSYFTALVEVPPTGSVTYEVLGSEPPGGAIEVSEPAIMRDIRVVRVTFTPAFPSDGGTCSVDVELRFSGGVGVNEKTRELPLLSPAFERLYASQVLNYDPAAHPKTRSVELRDPVPNGARYLIITADTYYADVAPLAQWRNAQGLLAKTVILSTTGSTAYNIHNYIQNAYDTWDVPPEYVLLVGDTEQLTGFSDLAYTDNYYGTMEGDDVIADVLVGRITADSHSDCQTQVAKILGYERTPLTGDPNWPLSATLIIADDNDWGDWVYYDNTWYVYDMMEEAAFAPIDTLFKKNDVARSTVYSSINDGAGFVNFRGQAWYNWPYPFDLDTYNVTTGWRLPVVVSATCGTGMYETDGFMCEEWVRAGSATSPKGGVAFFGTNTAYPGEVELSLRRGYVDEGFFDNVFSENGLTLGEASAGGKLNMLKLTGNQEEYEGWNLLGDPAMSLWSGPMRELHASHDLAVQPGHTDLTITVTDGTSYVEGAMVACVRSGETYSWGYTDALGEVTLSVDPVTEGQMTVTATARNSVPYENTVAVVTGPLPMLETITVDDSSGGNGDGYLSPGETAVLNTTLRNIGDASATAVSAVWRTVDPYVTVLDSTSAYADIAPDSIEPATDGFEVTLSPDCPSGHRLHYSLGVSYSGTDNTLVPSPIEVETGRFAVSWDQVDDGSPGGNGSGTLSPGETAGLSVGITNSGPCDLSAVRGTLVTDDPFVVVMSSGTSFEDLPAGWNSDCAQEPFVISISPSAPSGHEAALSLVLVGDGGQYTHSDTLALTYELTGGATMLPSGPDGYGYYVYDQTDGLFGPAPTYDWYDIAPPGPGTLITDVTDADAGLATLSILWNFYYYGQMFNQVTINSNGFLSMGWTDYRLGDNSSIPNPLGPQNMIAPFWDDLDPSAGGDVYKYLDAANHRWIFQFDHVRHWGLPYEETFQVILLHPAYYPTPTGDGQIIIQYQDVSMADGCTVGFENEAQDDGIQCLYDGAYNPQLAPIGPGTALLFTTMAPTGGGLPWLLLTDYTLDDSEFGNGNGRAEPGETVSLSVELTNDGGLSVDGVSLVLSSPDGLAAISDSTGTMSDLSPGASADSASDPFTFTVSEAVGDTVATLWTAIRGNGGDFRGAQRLELHIDLTSTSVPGETPTTFRFQPCSPNPFNDGTSMRLAMPQGGLATVRVYNVSGKVVRTLLNAVVPAGERNIVWDGRDESGERCASGVYMVRVETPSGRATRKAVLLR